MGDFPTEQTAVLAVDLQEDNLAEGAWPVDGYARVLENAGRVLTAARAAKLPVIYTRHWLAPDGSDAQRFEPRDESGRPLHSIAGTRGAAISPAVAPMPGDIVIDKQKFTAFHGTRLDAVLTGQAIDHLIVLGVWTEACVETTVWDALWRNLQVTLVKDACGSSTQALHMTAVLKMANWLWGGRVIATAELEKALAGRPFRDWRFERANAFPYGLDDIERLYHAL